MSERRQEERAADAVVQSIQYMVFGGKTAENHRIAGFCSKDVLGAPIF
ncbi:MAG: hypothetical protein OXE94_05010 [Aestuariivita sp.]|nr:hypothetical protein [Aestuariivita sp.]MCY4201939.1 hypothetical protein [Aestuariivita sp.]